jgi:uncharacterized protein (TIGR03067 family)
MVKTLTGLIAAVLVAAPVFAEDAKVKETAFDAAKLLGDWKITAGWKAGEKSEPDRLKPKIKITKDIITVGEGDMKFVIAYKIDAKASPTAIDMEIKEGPAGADLKAVGIVALDGDGFKLCYVQKEADDTKRPTKFESTKDNNAFLFTLKPADKK